VQQCVQLVGVVDPRRYVGGICVIGGNWGVNGTSRSDVLALPMHVTHLSLLQFRKIPGVIFHIDEGPSAVVSLLKGFEPC
jgi:hypothetical protein